MHGTSLAVTGVVLGFAIGLGSWILLPALPVRVTLELEVDVEPPGPGMVYWGDADLQEGGWGSFDLAEGRATYGLDLPAEFRVLRIHFGPIEVPLRLHSLQIDCLGARLQRLDANAGLGRFVISRDVDLAVRNDALHIQPLGPDPSIGLVIAEPLGADKRTRLWGWVIPIGVLGGLVGVGALGLATRKRAAVAGAPESARTHAHLDDPRLAAASIRRRRVAVLGISTVLSCVAGVVVYQLVSAWRAPTPSISTGDFTLSVVNRYGRLLSEKPGGVKFLLDPAAGYRNYPNQISPYFSIDIHGYRGGFDEADPRPRAMVLGGSTTFGHGLEADELCLSACLERLDPTRQYVNAGVIGHMSGQELSEMVHRGDLVEASVFVVFDGWNDFFNQRAPNPEGVDYGHNRGPLRRLEQILLDRPREFTSPIVPALSSIDSDLHEEMVIEAYTRNLARMARHAELRGAQLLIAFQPDLDCKRKLTAEEAAFSDPEMHAEYVAFLARAREFCDRNGIAWIDLNEEPRLRDREDGLFFDRVHLNAEGTRIVAQAIMERLRGF